MLCSTALWLCLFWVCYASAAAASSCPEVAEPVCGIDGLSYYNECLARLHKVDVAKAGYCEDSFLKFTSGTDTRSSTLSPASQTEAAQVDKKRHRLVPKERAPAPVESLTEITSEVINAFTADGFVYLGKMELAKGPTHLTGSGIQEATSLSPILPASVSAIRATPEGHIYVLRQKPRVQLEMGSATRGSSQGISSDEDNEPPVLYPNIPSSARAADQSGSGMISSSYTSSPASVQEEDGPLVRRPARSLSIIVGPDERKLCPAGPPPYPYSAIGQIDFLEKNIPYICTGTLITPSLVLTAAHCVWDVESQTFADMVTFAPGRYRTADGKVFNPHGQYKWSHATLMKNYLTSGEGQADIALVKLDGSAPAGAGTMGLKTDCTSSSQNERNMTVTTAGYPSDKPEGECNMAVCSVSFNCAKESTRHSCDTFMGQSGSAFWDDKFFIRGVHVRGLIDEQVNEFTTIGPKVLGKIKDWESQDAKATAAAAAARTAAKAAGATQAAADQAAAKAATLADSPGANSVQS